MLRSWIICIMMELLNSTERMRHCLVESTRRAGDDMVITVVVMQGTAAIRASERGVTILVTSRKTDRSLIFL